ncbi:MAG TPA: hypothetical protein VLE89_02325 [Chlamydiales bacterium]|nr:hypothetical protein [Chlamydiales bacterium]
MTIEDTGEPGKVSPSDRKLYEQEYKHGADLFQRALSEHSKADNIYQKEEFKEVMDQAMQVLNETARELKRQGLLKQNEKIAQDYNDYQSNPTKEGQSRLSQDLDKAKKSL